MNCQETREFLDRYVDGELAGDQQHQVEAHIAQCPLCQLEYEKEQKFDTLVRNHVHREDAPFELREAVIDRLERPSPFKTWFNFPHLTPAFKMVLSGVMIFIVTTLVVLNTPKPFPLFTEAVSNHIAYLKGSYPVEIISNDMEEVTIWFQGKMDFKVHVPDLSAQGFHLVGGRLCHLKDRKVAYLVYEKDGRKVSAFIMDTRGMRIPKSKKTDAGKHYHYAKSVKGYQSVLCLSKKDSGVGCVYVFDVPDVKLMHII